MALRPAPFGVGFTQKEYEYEACAKKCYKDTYKNKRYYNKSIGKYESYNECMERCGLIYTHKNIE